MTRTRGTKDLAASRHPAASNGTCRRIVEQTAFWTFCRTLSESGRPAEKENTQLNSNA